MDKRKLATQKDYSIISSIYAHDFGQDFEYFDFIEQLIRELPDLQNGKVVDLGSGPGTVVDYLFQRAVHNVTAVDITSEFCGMIAKKYENEPSVQIYNGDMVEFIAGHVDSSIAAYTANYSIIHIPDEEIDPLFQEIHRTLVPHGMFFMSCHTGAHKGMEIEPYLEQQDPRLNGDEHLEAYMNYFTEDELKNRLFHAGLKVIRMETFEVGMVPGEIAVPKIWLLARKVK